MRALLAITLVLLEGCGGLDNEPLRVGIIRGTIEGATSRSIVSVLGFEALTTTPDDTGRFELRDVPWGPRELLVVRDERSARRLSLDVGPAAIVELAEVTLEPAERLEVEFAAPGGQRVTGWKVSLLGTPFSATQRGTSLEGQLIVPSGCYEVSASAVGLGTVTRSVCVTGGAMHEVEIRFEPPDGSPGREGCPLTGCVGTRVCGADLSCH